MVFIVYQAHSFRKMHMQVNTVALSRRLARCSIHVIAKDGDGDG
jgi:hypothetical protein